MTMSFSAIATHWKVVSSSWLSPLARSSNTVSNLTARDDVIIYWPVLAVHSILFCAVRRRFQYYNGFVRSVCEKLINDSFRRSYYCLRSRAIGSEFELVHSIIGSLYEWTLYLHTGHSMSYYRGRGSQIDDGNSKISIESCQHIIS